MWCIAFSFWEMRNKGVQEVCRFGFKHQLVSAGWGQLAAAAEPYPKLAGCDS